MQRLQEVRHRQVDRPEHLGWVHQDFSEETSNAEADQLRSDCDEDARTDRRIAPVEELLSCKRLRGQC